MKLVSLNIWGGKVHSPLLQFLKEQSNNIDIFCFQEMLSTDSPKTEVAGYHPHIYTEISNVLTNHQGYFAPAQDNFQFNDSHFEDQKVTLGLAIFVRKNLNIIKHESIFVHGIQNGLKKRRPR